MIQVEIPCRIKQGFPGREVFDVDLIGVGLVRLVQGDILVVSEDLDHIHMVQGSQLLHLRIRNHLRSVLIVHVFQGIHIQNLSQIRLGVVVVLSKLHKLTRKMIHTIILTSL